MRIAFVQDILGFSIPLGITMIAGVLRKGGHEVDLFVVENNLKDRLEEIKKFEPDIIGFSVISGSHQGYIKIAQEIKKKLDIPILWGGPHVTFFPKIIENVEEANPKVIGFDIFFSKKDKQSPEEIIRSYNIKSENIINYLTNIEGHDEIFRQKLDTIYTQFRQNIALN